MRLLFWSFFPDEALPLLIVAAGFALMLGFRHLAATLVGTVVLFALLGPFVEAIVTSLSPGWQILILAVIGLVILRALIGLVIGKRTASHLAALLLHDLILLPFRALRWFIDRRAGH